MELKDLTGKRFGRWTVLHRDMDTKKKGGTYWVCRCDCGTIKSVHMRALLSGKSRSCGCLRKERPNRAFNLVGQRFGRLVVVDVAKDRGDMRRRWVCRCDCGNIIEARTSSLTSGNTQSCGCFQKDRAGAYAFKDLTGQKFGKLTVLYRTEGDWPNAHWTCQCDCGRVADGIDGWNLTHGVTRSCGCKAMPFGEEMIGEYLELHGLEYGRDFIDQVSMPDLRGMNDGYLSYDFEVLCPMHCFIEYQGRQHYEPIDYFGGEEQLAVQQAHDEVKRQYALEHRIPLLTIPYTANTYDAIASKLDDFFCCKDWRLEKD